MIICGYCIRCLFLCTGDFDVTKSSQCWGQPFSIGGALRQEQALFDEMQQVAEVQGVFRETTEYHVFWIA